MAVINSATQFDSVRAPRQEVAADRVRSATEAAVEAFRSAAADRRLIHDLEWGQTTDDTLGDIDVVADTLQGFAAWVAGGRPHPQRQSVVQTLRDLARQTNSDLPARLVGNREHFANLFNHVSALEHLRSALLDYFEAGESSADSDSRSPG